jgi:hypothetical protein
MLMGFQDGYSTPSTHTWLHLTHPRLQQSMRLSGTNISNTAFTGFKTCPCLYEWLFKIPDMIYHTSCSDFISKIYPHEEMFNSLNNPSFFIGRAILLLEPSLARPSVFCPWGRASSLDLASPSKSKVIFISLCFPRQLFRLIDCFLGDLMGFFSLRSRFSPLLSLRRTVFA